MTADDYTQLKIELKELQDFLFKLGRAQELVGELFHNKKDDFKRYAISPVDFQGTDKALLKAFDNAVAKIREKLQNATIREFSDDYKKFVAENKDIAEDIYSYVLSGEYKDEEDSVEDDDGDDDNDDDDWSGYPEAKSWEDYTRTEIMGWRSLP